MWTPPPGAWWREKGSRSRSHPVGCGGRWLWPPSRGPERLPPGEQDGIRVAEQHDGARATVLLADPHGRWLGEAALAPSVRRAVRVARSWSTHAMPTRIPSATTPIPVTVRATTPSTAATPAKNAAPSSRDSPHSQSASRLTGIPHKSSVVGVGYHGRSAVFASVDMAPPPGSAILPATQYRPDAAGRTDCAQVAQLVMQRLWTDVLRDVLQVVVRLVSKTRW